MKKNFVVVGIIIFIVFAALYIVQAENIDVEPGSEEDPLVTKSYVDEKFDNLEIGNSLVAPTFQVVELKESEKLIGKEGTEIIIRSGTALAIEGENGDGIADISSDVSKDYFQGDKLVKNHLLIISRDDGRGLKADKGIVYLLVKGDYEIIT